jgi:hypothetical protein
MRIRTGLLKPSAAMRQFAQQEGLDWIELGSADEISGSGISALVVPARTTPADLPSIEAYLAGGGAVLGSASSFAGLLESRERRLRFLLAADGFSHAGIVDLDTDGLIPREANVLRTEHDTYAVFAGEWEGGVAVVLPFDPAEAWTDVRAGYRSFYIDRDRLPWERVSLVAKGAVRKLLRDSLIYLHRSRGLPYVHTWYFPEGQPNTFVFRIDTDGAGQREIDELRGLLDEHRLPATWFLDLRTQGPLLSRYREFAGHEMGVHCDEHRIFATDGENRANIERALAAIRGAGFQPEGFAAPYGYWDLFLGNIIDELGFSYSSEFSWAYDTLPGAPVTPAGEYRTLQVPIHPVSVGSLRRAGCPPAWMARYYEGVVRRYMATGDPMVFYHHPSHREPGVLRAIFEAVRGAGIPSMTMAAFAHWWNERLGNRPQFEVRGGAVRVSGVSGRSWISVVMPDGRRALSPPAGEIRLDALSPGPGSVVNVPVVPGDILRTREWDFREFLGQSLLKLRSVR